LLLFAACPAARVHCHALALRNPKERIMAQGKVVMLGLNQTGVIAFIIMFFLCFPLCFIPFLLDSCKGVPE
jgi:hypothetical protein